MEETVNQRIEVDFDIGPEGIGIAGIQSLHLLEDIPHILLLTQHITHQLKQILGILTPSEQLLGRTTDMMRV